MAKLITLGYSSLDSTDVNPITFNLKRANRHGLIAGATGTGKTVTLQSLAESFSDNGVPVLITDIKGDLSGISQAGKSHPKINERLQTLGLSIDDWQSSPSIFWDVYGKSGHPIRATITDLGPLLLGKMLKLNDTQTGILNIAFAVADDEGLGLLDLKDLRSIIQYVGENAKELKNVYGNISSSSIGAIQRRILMLDRSGAKIFFGEPMLDFSDLLRKDSRGQGYVNILAADKLYMEPETYSVVLLWMLSELFENLPEIGDPEKPELVLFFDEAHLIFKNSSSTLIDKIEQVVRLIRSKGVGVYFITQSPGDVPDPILAQLGNRFLHALRAYTPKEQKVVKAAAETFRSNKSFSTLEAITNLGVGEALVSTIQENGAPSIVSKVFIKPPISRIGPATIKERKNINDKSPCSGLYDEAVDRKSAFEILAKRAEASAKESERTKENKKRSLERPKSRSRGRKRQGVMEAFAKSMARSLGSKAGRSIARGILGSLFKGR